MITTSLCEEDGFFIRKIVVRVLRPWRALTLPGLLRSFFHFAKKSGLKIATLMLSLCIMSCLSVSILVYLYIVYGCFFLVFINTFQQLFYLAKKLVCPMLLQRTSRKRNASFASHTKRRLTFTKHRQTSTRHIHIHILYIHNICIYCARLFAALMKQAVDFHPCLDGWFSYSGSECRDRQEGYKIVCHQAPCELLTWVSLFFITGRSSSSFPGAATSGDNTTS